MCRSIPLALMAVALAGCATSTGRPAAASARFGMVAHGSGLTISDGELLTSRDATSTLRALERLRPAYLQTLGSFVRLGEVAPAPPVVFINGAYSGPIDVLQNLPVEHVVGIRLMRPMEAMQRYGSRLGSGGVILVTLRHDD